VRLTDSEATLIFAELLVILRDRGWLRLDERELTIESGLAIYIPPNSLH